MTSFWPEDINISDVQSPLQILGAANDEWQATSGGKLDLILHPIESAKKGAVIVVHARDLTRNRTTSLFSVVHRMEAPYPATIEFGRDELPDFLKRSYEVAIPPVFGGLSYSLTTTFRTVANEWVSETPSEFRDKLKMAFNAGDVKARILNLLSSGPPAPQIRRDPVAGSADDSARCDDDHDSSPAE